MDRREIRSNFHVGRCVVRGSNAFGRRERWFRDRMTFLMLKRRNWSQAQSNEILIAPHSYAIDLTGRDQISQSSFKGK